MDNGCAAARDEQRKWSLLRDICGDVTTKSAPLWSTISSAVPLAEGVTPLQAGDETGRYTRYMTCQWRVAEHSQRPSGIGATEKRLTAV